MTLLADLIKKPISKATATAIPAIPATHEGENKGKIAKIATVAIASPQTDKTVEPTSDTRQNDRRQKVLTMLEENPDKQRAIYTDTKSDSSNVILTIAVRNVATCEMLIPKERYDPFRLLELIEQYDGCLH